MIEIAPSPREAPNVKTPHGSSGTFLLFVYGTLKRGGCLHGPLAGQVCRGQTRTLPGYALHHLGDYPGLVAAAGSGQTVQGELYEVDCGLLGWLDLVEDAPELYTLGPIQLESVEGPVWTYFYRSDVSHRPRIESGTWEIGEEQ
jgi:gamma-glutamylcyclotransferase (GGCT)/AIG2-like uncharacterized protein YtfP